ncbi:MAG: hypothetical protein ABI589_07395 [Burkholderiales bacterium]
MLLYRELGWWYWAVIELLLLAGLAGRVEAFLLAAMLSIVQVVHFRLREGAFAAFAVQVRLAYAGVLGFCLLASILFWLPACGTLALVLFGYCPLARMMSLLSWNRREPLSWRLARRTFTAPPGRGSILHGLPAAR